MKTRGKIQAINRGIDGGFVITLSLPESRYEELLLLEPEDLSVELTKYKSKRSLDANSYFHVLVGKIAEKIGASRTSVKNQLIGDYGQMELDDGQMVTVTTRLGPEKVQEKDFEHWRYYRCEYVRDKAFYIYIVMRGSHTYDTKEMSILIDGAISEAKELGIETLPPDKIERLKKQWQVKK